MSRTLPTIDDICADILASGIRLGDYQRDLLLGRARWSGADLKGNARKWGGRYKRSRDRVADLIRDEAARKGVAVRWLGGTAKEGPLRPEVVGPLATW